MMNVIKYSVVTVALCGFVSGCSSVSPSKRASLVSDSDSRSSGYYENNALPAGAAIRYYDNASAARDTGDTSPRYWRAPARDQAEPAPRRLLSGPSPSARNAPLRRFAAMPRHAPHAAHVRQDETSCLNSGIVQTTAFVRPRSSIGGGQCYVSRPFTMFAAGNGRVQFEPAATLRCQMVPSVETWVAEVLRPAARKLLGSDVVEVRVAGSYGCRRRNHQAGAKLSEHGRGNALDISKFHLADGRVITVKEGWYGSEQERRFLRYVHRGACEHFSTVLGPNADRHHRDHFHLDLASHGRDETYRVCK